ncbi:MAG: hypothetical protein WAM97_11320 [Acidimicrobiales bacterium]
MPNRRRRYLRRRSRNRSLGVAALRRRRRLSAGLVVVAIVVGVFAAVVIDQIPRAERPYESSLDSTFATSVAPIAEASNYTGTELSSVLGQRSHVDLNTFQATLASMIGDADQAVSDFEGLNPPGQIQAATLSCLASLKMRAAALATLHQAVATVLTNPLSAEATGSATQAESTIEQLSSTLSTSDHRWATCRSELLKAPGKRENSVPVSAWVGSPSTWDSDGVVGFVQALLDAGSAGAGQPLAIVAISSTPPSEVTVGGYDVLPVTNSVDLHVVVENTSTLAEHDVTVKATLSPIAVKGNPGSTAPTASAASTVSAAMTASIAAGQSVSLHLSPLQVTPGDDYLLDVTASEPGMTQPVSRSYRIEIESTRGVTS